MVDVADPSTKGITNKESLGSHSKLKPMSDRFNEQIAEDIVYDLVDEVDFWALDGGNSEGAMKELTETTPAVVRPADMESGVAVAMEGRRPAPAEMMPA